MNQPTTRHEEEDHETAWQPMRMAIVVSTGDIEALRDELIATRTAHNRDLDKLINAEVNCWDANCTLGLIASWLERKISDMPLYSSLREEFEEQLVRVEEVMGRGSE